MTRKKKKNIDDEKDHNLHLRTTHILCIIYYNISGDRATVDRCYIVSSFSFACDQSLLVPLLLSPREHTQHTCIPFVPSAMAAQCTLHAPLVLYVSSQSTYVDHTNCSFMVVANSLYVQTQTRMNENIIFFFNISLRPQNTI